jgi:hypothetical protein
MTEKEHLIVERGGFASPVANRDKPTIDPTIGVETGQEQDRGGEIELYHSRRWLAR